MDGFKITLSILGLISSGSRVSSRVISGCIWNWCLSGVKSVTVDFGPEIKSELSFRYISVYHETLYQRQPSGLWPHTLYGEVVSAG